MGTHPAEHLTQDTRHLHLFAVMTFGRSSFSSRGAVGMGAGVAMGASRLGMGGAMMSGKAGSVYGGAGGMGVRISSSSAMAGGFGLGGGGGGGGFGLGGGGGGGFGLGGGGGGGAAEVVAVSEKMEMQNLNHRLASYLDKVAILEKANFELEEKIKNWGIGRVVEARDFSAFLIVIEEIRSKMMAAGTLIAELILEVDNTKLAADDFRIKYESELGLRMSVDADIAGLKRMLGELALLKTDLEMQLEGLREEKEYLTKNHEEELLAIRAQMTGQVNVEVDAAPAADLTVIMSDIREQYEAMVAKSHKDAEAWFKAKAETVQTATVETVAVIQTTSVEVKESKSTLMTLQLELQSLMSMKASLELQLAELEGRYGAKMMQLQAQVVSMEGQLTQIRADTERTGQEYQALLDIKSRLEMEITEYRRLMDGEIGGAVVIGGGAAVSGGSITTKKVEVVTVTKTAISPVVESSASIAATIAAAAAIAAIPEVVAESSVHTHTSTTVTEVVTEVTEVTQVEEVVDAVVTATEEVVVTEE